MFQNNGYSEILNEICLLVFHTMNIVIFHNLEYNNQIVYAQIRKKSGDLMQLMIPKNDKFIYEPRLK